MAMPEARHSIELDFLLEQIKKTTFVFSVPERFDPRTADPARLIELGLPPRPNRVKEPELYAFWWRMFSPPLRFVQPEFSFPFPRDFFGPTRTLNGLNTRHERSLNWSGGYLVPRHGHMFTAVYGMWQVPTPLAPDGAVAGQEYHSSTWIGFDGQRQYYQSTLPQIGTAQHVAMNADGTTTPMISAWWQWWARGQLNPPIGLSLPVKAGDLVMCNMIVIDPQRVRFYIKNETTGAFIRPFDSPAPPAADPVRVSGATAEWVMERPRDLVTQNLYELPNYDTVLFTNCLAVSAEAPGATGHTHTLLGAKLINMYALRNNPPRTADVSVPEREGDQELATFYR